MSGDGSDGTSANSRGRLSRRETLTALSVVGAAGLARCAGVASSQSTTDISEISLRAFVTGARGDEPPFDDDTMVFDPGPESVPLNRVYAENAFDTSPTGPITDSRRLVTRPSEGCDRDAGYDGSWEPLTWGELSAVGGEVEIGEVTGDGTEVTLDVESAVPNGLYTVWVVKFAELRDPDEYDAFVTPRGNGLVGFQNLGPKTGGSTETDNIFSPDDDGNATLTRVNEGGSLTGVPGFRPLDTDPVPFVGETDDYRQSEERLGRIDADLNDEDEIHFVAAYHYDNQTWGVYPGPYHLNHFDARFDL